MILTIFCRIGCLRLVNKFDQLLNFSLYAPLLIKFLNTKQSCKKNFKTMVLLLHSNICYKVWNVFQYKNLQTWSNSTNVMMMMMMMMMVMIMGMMVKMNYFCRMVHQCKTLSLISSWDLKDYHHRKYPTRREQDLNLRKTWVQVLLKNFVQ